MNIAYGSLSKYPQEVVDFIKEYAAITTPDSIHLCDGSPEEKSLLIDQLVQKGTLEKLEKYDNCYIARTHPTDVARVESKTFMCTPEKETSVPLPKDPSKGQLGNWANDKEMLEKITTLLKGCMKGRTMYVLTFCMGPLGCDFSKIGVQITDSPYVVVSMGVMTTMGDSTLKYLKSDQFVKCVHSVLVPLPLPKGADEHLNWWPCNPEKTLITHYPLTNTIISVGSGYGGNSLLGKKCFALRIASNIAHREGWLAEHMLIMGLENDKKEKMYIAAAFPSACGKTNLAMLTPAIPGWKVTCVGDDIAWMKFDDEGVLRAINPEKGFFGVAPGTSNSTNKVAMECIKSNTVFTNVAKTSDGGVFWEGLENDVDLNKVEVTDWYGKKGWKKESGTKAAHPNSRFCAPVANCPILDESWNDPKGVPISAIIFGGRRPKNIPLVYESLNWEHGVMMGAGMKSETTAAAIDMKANTIAHDPFAMRPFLGYNAGEYIKHWISMGKVKSRKLPKIFHVNWFLKDEQGKFMWPGFNENIRILEWIFRRCKNEDVAQLTAIGYVPKTSSLNVNGLDVPNIDKLFSVDKAYFTSEAEELDEYFDQYLNKSYPIELKSQVTDLKQRLAQ